jgi:hypothetical protein
MDRRVPVLPEHHRYHRLPEPSQAARETTKTTTMAEENNKPPLDDHENVVTATTTHDEDVSSKVAAPTITFTVEEENRVYRKLDWNLMPLIFVLYSLSVLDRSNLGNAKIAGMEKDIDLGGRRYDWLATVFYIACECSPLRDFKRKREVPITDEDQIN